MNSPSEGAPFSAQADKERSSGSTSHCIKVGILSTQARAGRQAQREHAAPGGADDAITIGAGHGEREDDARSAIEIANWFRTHVLRLMDGEDALTPEAREALQYLLKRGEAKVSSAAVKNILRKRKAFLRADVVDNAIAELETHGYAQLAAPEPNGTKGRPLCPLLELHPDLLVEEDEWH